MKLIKVAQTSTNFIEFKEDDDIPHTLKSISVWYVLFYLISLKVINFMKKNFNKSSLVHHIIIDNSELTGLARVSHTSLSPRIM